MASIGLTIAVAFVIILLAMAALGISWLLTGKLSLKPGACGRDPTKKKDDASCGTDQTCGLCKRDDIKKKPEVRSQKSEYGKKKSDSKN